MKGTVPVVEFYLRPATEDVLDLCQLTLLALQARVQASQLLVQLDPDI
jgi:hypothetical protein